MAPTTVTWQATVSGGKEPFTYEFVSSSGGSVITEHSGPSPEWKWTPGKAGTYRMSVIARDRPGNEVRSDWSGDYEIYTPLEFKRLEADSGSPQMIGSTIAWTAAAEGGYGTLSYKFIIKDTSGKETLKQSGNANQWNWIPGDAGQYQIKVIVADEDDNSLESDWSEVYDIYAPLGIESLVPEIPSPEVHDSKVAWIAKSRGGYGTLNYEFFLQKDGGDGASVQSGPSDTWKWIADTDGTYRIKVRLTDEAGNSIDGDWSEDYEIYTPMVFQQLEPDLKSPRMTGTDILWTATADGGYKTLSYEFIIRGSSGKETSVYKSESGQWTWRPEQADTYQVKVIVTDKDDNRVESPWSDPYEIYGPLAIETMGLSRLSPEVVNVPIGWRPRIKGGYGDLSFDFSLRKGLSLVGHMQSGPSEFWWWTPSETGTYNVRVVITDSLDNRIDSGWSEDYEIYPPLVFQGLQPDLKSPRMTGTDIVWTATADGGYKTLSYEFIIRGSSEKETSVYKSESGQWTWRPEQADTYQVKVIVTDKDDNRVESPWSDPYEIYEPLRIMSLAPDVPSPEVRDSTITWKALSRGGYGKIDYEFFLKKEGDEGAPVQKGPADTWAWTAGTVGAYRVKVVVTDEEGNRIESNWSDAYEIYPPLVFKQLIPEPESPSVLDTMVKWTTTAEGGYGILTYEFVLKKDTAPGKSVQKGPGNSWDWKAVEEGPYTVKTMITDQDGNRVESGWSKVYEIYPPLVLRKLSADPKSPRVEGTVIEWTAAATGGYKKLRYEFFVKDSTGKEISALKEENQWRWVPYKAGTYRIKVAVTDADENRVESDWSEEYDIYPPLVFKTLKPTPPSPQMEGSAVIWTALAEGGYKKLSYEFIVRSDTGKGTSVRSDVNRWRWVPKDTGMYKVMAIVKDSIGNEARSAWADYEVVPKLEIISFSPDIQSPQRAIVSTVRWKVRARGGVGDYSYRFRTFDGKTERTGDSGPTPLWDWVPERTGTYKIKAIVKDERGNTADSGWSSPFVIKSPLDVQSLIAVLPFENLSGKIAPLDELRKEFMDKLKEQGFRLLDDAVLEDFIERHRIRHTGGLSLKTAELFKEETGAEGILITSVELFQEGGPPKIALLSRMVLSGKRPYILWMESAGMAGDESPGLLGLGIISDRKKLVEKTYRSLLGSLIIYLLEEDPRFAAHGQQIQKDVPGRVKEKYAPRTYYRSDLIDTGKEYTVAIIPFSNRSDRKRAGLIMALHFVKQMLQFHRLRVIEPGVVRQELLDYRIIYETGVSLADADVLFSKLNADLVVSGRVLEYYGLFGTPRVDFSTEIIDKESRRTVWSSKSYNVGDEGVFFFDIGEVSTAYGLTSEMVKVIVSKIFRGEQ